MNKVPFLFGICCFIVYRVLLYLTDNLWLSLSIFLLPIGLIIFNLIVRKKIDFSSWFLSPLNFFIERSTHTTTSDIDNELLFAKLLEVSELSEFKLLDSNASNMQILLGTSVNFWTWGENVYVQIEESSEGSVIQFTSVTLFGNSSWKRNDKNCLSFIESFESSLTI